MKLKPLWLKFKRLIFLLRYKGIKYTFNYVHFYLLYPTKNPLLIKLLYWLETCPSYLEVEVTTRCNLRCIICEHTYWREENRDMSFEEFKSIIDQFPKLKWIGLTGIGESFLNKDFLKMLRYVKDKDIFVELYDNFFLIDRETARELIAMAIDKIYISLDAATKDTYEKIRVGSDFERVVRNLKNFFQAKKEMKAHFPEIAFHYIVNKLNLSEMPQYIELVRSIVGEESATVQFSRMLHAFKGTKDLFTEVPAEIVQATEKKAREFNLKVVWSADTPQIKPPISKCTEWTMPFIFVNGDVIPCCAGNEAENRDFQKKTALGNIFKQDFKEIWRGERYKNLRKMLKKGNIPASCRNCPLYQLNK